MEKSLYTEKVSLLTVVLDPFPDQIAEYCDPA